jgi:hypothetical protein
MNSVVKWLESPAGLDWSAGHFTYAASECHDMIEILNDYDNVAISGHIWVASGWMLDYLKDTDPIWADLTWTPDQPPDRVLPVRPVQGHQGHLGRHQAGEMPGMQARRSEEVHRGAHVPELLLPRRAVRTGPGS